MAAARDIIAQCGTAGASVEAISRRAGVTKGAFYYAFASKAALLTELGRSSAVTLLGHGTNLLSLPADAAAKDFYDSVRASRAELVFQVELWLYASRDEGMRRALTEALSEFGNQLEEALTQASVTDASTKALATRSLLTGLALQMVLDDTLTADRVAPVLARHLHSIGLPNASS